MFGYMLRALGRYSDDNDVASIIVIRNVSCPYCGSVYGVLALGAVRRRVRRTMSVMESYMVERCDPEFRDTHLANPIRCPVCGKEYIVFVGVEKNRLTDSYGSVHVKVSEKDDLIAEECSRWPHKGLVSLEVIEYTPGSVTVFRDMEQYMDYRGLATAVSPERNTLASVPRGLGEAGRLVAAEIKGVPERKR